MAPGEGFMRVPVAAEATAREEATWKQDHGGAEGSLPDRGVGGVFWEEGKGADTENAASGASHDTYSVNNGTELCTHHI